MWRGGLTEARVGSIVFSNMFIDAMGRAVLETLAYSDVFEYPLHLDELHRYLPIRAEVAQMPQALNALTELVGKQDDFYFLSGREKIVEIRKRRESHSHKLIGLALRYGRMLGFLPFIRMVALTGSLAVMNSSQKSDFDYMLVTAPNRVWTARAFALLFNRITRLLSHTLCPNIIVSENMLAWSTHDLYSARELCQMIPITGMDQYQRLLKANEWAKDFLPNCGDDFSREQSATEVVTTFQSLLEFPLRGKLGNRFEKWEMDRKIERFSKQAGFGDETVFNAEVCQGNFHHHHKWTREIFEEKISVLETEIQVSSETIAT